MYLGSYRRGGGVRWAIVITLHKTNCPFFTNGQFSGHLFFENFCKKIFFSIFCFFSKKMFFWFFEKKNFASQIKNFLFFFKNQKNIFFEKKQKIEKKIFLQKFAKKRCPLNCPFVKNGQFVLCRVMTITP